MLAAIRRPDGGALDLTLTTNGSALRALAGPLAEAGLQRVTVSLDSLDDAVFGAMNGIDFPVARVLDGIDAALEAGLAPVKVNMVVRRGVNESSVVPMARWARETGVILRFIEYMDVGHSNGWRLDEVVPAGGAHRRRSPPSLADRAGGAELPRRGRRPLALPRRRRRVRGDLVGHRSRSAATARARASRPRASSTPACSRSTATTSGRVLRVGARTRSWPALVAAIWRAAATATPSCAPRRPDAAQDRDVRDGRLSRPLRPQPVHSPDNSWIAATGSIPEFVDNRVDPPGRPPLT